MKEDFGTYIKRNRKRLKLTQTQLAYKLNIDGAKLSKIENGKLSLNEGRLRLLSNAFGVELAVIKKLYFGDKIAQTLFYNMCEDDTLIVAEEMYRYYKTKRSKQGNLNFDNEK